MKKILLKIVCTCLIICASFTSFGQLLDGSIAPDFTVTDIYGTTYTLSDYTNNGIPVILQFSAVWSPPDWVYQQSGALESIWANHGFSATGDSSIMIFFIESDGALGLNELQGDSPSIGDWTSAVSFPIIDAPISIPTAYNINNYPTVYTICQDGTLTVTGQISDVAHLDFINQNCFSSVDVTPIQFFDVNKNGIYDEGIDITIQNQCIYFLR